MYSEVQKKISRVQEMAKNAGREPTELRFSVSLRLIVGETEPEAWDKAHSILESVLKSDQNSVRGLGADRLESEGSRRLIRFARKGDVLDERLYMPIAKATGAAGNTTALVGTAEQVVESLFRYYKIGCTTILIRGFDPL